MSFYHKNIKNMVKNDTVSQKVSNDGFILWQENILEWIWKITFKHKHRYKRWDTNNSVPHIIKKLQTNTFVGFLAAIVGISQLWLAWSRIRHISYVVTKFATYPQTLTHIKHSSNQMNLFFVTSCLFRNVMILCVNA